MNLKAHRPEDSNDKKIPQQPNTYKIDKIVFIVDSVFPKSAQNTLGAVLLRLIKNDCKGDF